MPYRFVEEEIEDFPEGRGKKYRFIPEEPPSKLRSLLSAAPKGFGKELRQQITQSLEFLPQQFGLLKEGEDISPISDDEFYERLETLLPTQEGFAEKALERGGKIAPYALIGGGNPLMQILRSTLGGFLGQSAEEVGLPPWAQGLAELPAFGLPDLGKKIIPRKGQKELVEGARQLGLAEEEIAPLIQSEKKQSLLGKVIPRRSRTQKILDKSYKALGNVYNRLESLPEATQPLSMPAAEKVIDSLQNQMKEFPAGLRKLIEEDIEDLVKSPITGSTLINFFKDVNYYLGKGFDQLGRLKEPVFEALSDISPQLANDFRLTNKLYSQYAKISNRLKPNLVSDLFTAGEAVRLLMGISTGNFPLLAESGLEYGGRLLARELLLNPRLQNLSSKLIDALNANKSSLATELTKKIANEVEETNPDVAEQLKTINFNRLLGKSNK